MNEGRVKHEDDPLIKAEEGVSKTTALANDSDGTYKHSRDSYGSATQERGKTTTNSEVEIKSTTLPAKSDDNDSDSESLVTKVLKALGRVFVAYWCILYGMAALMLLSTFGILLFKTLVGGNHENTHHLVPKGSDSCMSSLRTCLSSPGKDTMSKNECKAEFILCGGEFVEEKTIIAKWFQKAEFKKRKEKAGGIDRCQAQLQACIHGSEGLEGRMKRAYQEICQEDFKTCLSKFSRSQIMQKCAVMAGLCLATIWMPPEALVVCTIAATSCAIVA